MYNTIQEVANRFYSQMTSGKYTQIHDPAYLAHNNCYRCAIGLLIDDIEEIYEDQEELNDIFWKWLDDNIPYLDSKFSDCVRKKISDEYNIYSLFHFFTIYNEDLDYTWEQIYQELTQLAELEKELGSLYE